MCSFFVLLRSLKEVKQRIKKNTILKLVGLAETVATLSCNHTKLFQSSIRRMMVKFVYIVLSILCTCSKAFQIAPRLLPYPNRVFAVESTPFVEADIISCNGCPVIIDIDKKIAVVRKKMKKFEAKLCKFTSQIETLEKRKALYIGENVMDKLQNFSESTARSAVKAMLWRMIAASITFINTLKFSKNMGYSFQVVGSDFFCKALTMFLGECLLNKCSIGRNEGVDSTGRSIAKAVIWRLFAICNTLSVCFFVSKDLDMASKVAGCDAVFKTFLMVVYERVWANIKWGKSFVHN